MTDFIHDITTNCFFYDFAIGTLIADLDKKKGPNTCFLITFDCKINFKLLIRQMSDILIDWVLLQKVFKLHINTNVHLAFKCLLFFVLNSIIHEVQFFPKILIPMGIGSLVKFCTHRYSLFIHICGSFQLNT